MNFELKAKNDDSWQDIFPLKIVTLKEFVMSKIFVISPNKTCENCNELLFGGIRVDGRMLLACRKENCEWSLDEAETAYETTEGEKIVARKVKTLGS